MLQITNAMALALAYLIGSNEDDLARITADNGSMLTIEGCKIVRKADARGDEYYYMYGYTDKDVKVAIERAQTYMECCAIAGVPF